jgi:hypothetical protein
MLHQDYLGDITGGHSLHPQSKFYDIIYSDQFKDLREYAKIANKYEIDLLREDKRENSCIDEVGIVDMVTMTSSTTTDTASIVSSYGLLEVGDGGIGSDSVILIQGNNGTYYRAEITALSSSVVYWVALDNGLGRYLNGKIIKISTNPIISSGSKLSIDLIGSPDNYPDVVKTRLASGVGINGVYPNLVSDTGDSLIPDGINGEFKHSSKATENFNVIYTYDSGDSWFSAAKPLLPIENRMVDSAFQEGSVVIASYTSNNAPYQITDPKPVLEVTPKAITSNSHSIYKGGDIASQVSGKIATGSSDGGYESRVLENCEILYKYRSDTYIGTLKRGDTILLVANNLGRVGHEGIENHIYEVTTDTYTTVHPANDRYYDDDRMTDQGLNIISNHQTLSLNTDDSSASKWFEVLEEDEFKY